MLLTSSNPALKISVSISFQNITRFRLKALLSVNHHQLLTISPANSLTSWRTEKAAFSFQWADLCPCSLTRSIVPTINVWSAAMSIWIVDNICCTYLLGDRTLCLNTILMTGCYLPMMTMMNSEIWFVAVTQLVNDWACFQDFYDTFLTDSPRMQRKF